MAKGKPKKIFDARPDSIDFRDMMFVPSLVKVPPARSLSDYKKAKIPILDQGQEGACTGFGLATVIHYLTQQRDGKLPPQVSARMLYEMAKRHDEWEGEEYDGSSARGAMKGWHKHGVCRKTYWEDGTDNQQITVRRASDAAKRPLGAYFRVNHKDLVAMHTALAEVGILYATSVVHDGWSNVASNGVIEYKPKPIGGHAIAIVGYEQDGFWVQNSWGKAWGKEGFGFLSYTDWLENGMDVWVAQLGVPIRVNNSDVVSGRSVTIATTTFSFSDLRPHIVSIGNDGRLRKTGTFGNTEEDIHTIFEDHFPRITEGWGKKRLLLYAHGGLVSEKSAIQRVEDYLSALKGSDIYPLAFIWKTDYWTTLKNMLSDAFKRRKSEGILDATKDFMLDRIDDALEPIARNLTGKAQWTEMKENALLSTASSDGGARVVCDRIAKLAQSEPNLEIHVAGHSAGAIFHALLVQRLASEGIISTGPLKDTEGLGLDIESCTLWAPACTVRLFKETYGEVIKSRGLKNFALFNLTDEAEQDDDCARIYNKSLLYLVSNAFEEKARIPLFRPNGEPILGMDKFIRENSSTRRYFTELFKKRYADYVLCPNHELIGDESASKANKHGDFDDDEATVKATLARILATKTFKPKVEMRVTRKQCTETRKRMRNIN